MKRLTSTLLLLTLLIGLLPINALAKRNEPEEKPETPAMNIEQRDKAAASAETIAIASEADFLAFADQCKLDTYSRNKQVILVCDIKLSEKNFTGIPTFAGTFDGGGYTISGLDLSRSSVSYAGLFSRVQQTAVIKNLSVEGTVTPTGSPVFLGGIAGENSGVILNCAFSGVVAGSDYIGGIAGSNTLNGIISGCKSTGYVKGIHFTGGIAGKNDGNIAGCTNESMVNITNTDEDLSIESVEKVNSNLQNILNFLKNKEASSDEASPDTTTSDIGGIAGISEGVITGCTNNADVGYEHVGYNIGGIAGRHSGFIQSSTNNGTIRGRKDVGGIAGQAEPYIAVDLSTDIAYQLSEAIKDMNGSIATMLSHARNQSDVVESRLAVISDYTSKAIEDSRYLANNTVDFVNDVSGTAETIYSRVDYIFERAAETGGFADQTSDAARDLQNSMDGLNTTANDINVQKYMTAEDKATYDSAKLKLDSINKEHEGSFNKAYPVAYHAFIANATTDTGTYPSAADLTYMENDAAVTPLPAWAVNIIPTPSLAGDDHTNGKWVHSTDNAAFPKTSDNDDNKLEAEAKADASAKATLYADTKYTRDHSSTYAGDVAAQASIMTATLSKYLDVMSDQTRKDASSAINSAKSASDHLTKAGNELNSLIKTAGGYSDITFPTLSAEYKQRTNSLADNLAGMNDNFGILNTELHDSSDILINDFAVINDEFENIMLLFTDALDGALEADYTSVFNDTSLEEAENSKDAVIDACANYGRIYGDIDSGGIAGTMAIEYDFDQESDMTGIDNSKISSSYITKCILRDNSNYGNVTGEKDYTGGIVGLQEMGTILRGNNCSDISSKNGEYVGGISGSSLSYIIHSNAEGILSGTSFVGGIAGNGAKLRNNFAIVKIKDAERWYGAIAGHMTDNGDTELTDNHFVSDTLAGIDRVSIAGEAEPITYAQAEQKVSGLPEDFNYLTVTFVLDDEDLSDEECFIAKRRVSYSGNLTIDSYPSVEEKDGYYVSWDIPKLTDIRTDETVTASYRRYRTTLAEIDSDDLHQSELLVDGQFKDGDALVVKRSGYKDTGSSIKDLGLIVGNRSLDFKRLDDVETLEVRVPDDGAKEHVIRFKPQTKLLNFSGTSYALSWVKSDGSVKKLKSIGTMGNYDLYRIPGNHFTLRLSIIGGGRALLRYGAVLLALIGLIVFVLAMIIHTARKHGKDLPDLHRKIHLHVKKRIESKEQLFYDEKKDEKPK